MLTKKDREYLAQQFSDQIEIYEKGGKDYLGKLYHSASEERQLVLNLSTISGAIAAFTIPLFQLFEGLSLAFLLLAVACLFTVILMGFIGLSTELDKQIMGLVDGFRQLEKTYATFRNAVLQSFKEESMGPLENLVVQRQLAVFFQYSSELSSIEQFKFLRQYIYVH